MALDWEQLQYRREEARRRRRRQGRRRLGLLVLVVGAIAVAAIVLIGGGSASRTSSPPQARNAPRGRAGNAALERLVRLGLPLYCGGSHGRYVALTFDDGPGVYTHLALPLLRRFRARATFFLVGRNLATQWRAFPSEELKQGTLGDHTYTHPFLPALPAEAVRSELSRTQDQIAAMTGFRTELFRPPYGGVSAAIEAQARTLGMLTVLWNVDSTDALPGANKQRIAAEVERGLLPGSIILMHENRGQTIQALFRVILPSLRRKHLRAVTVPELLALDPPSMQQLSAGPRGCSYNSAISRGSG